MKTHSKVKPFKCNLCGYVATQRIHLTSHMRIHTGIKPYKCDQCEYTTSWKSNLTIHCKKHSKVKPFKCDYTAARPIGGHDEFDIDTDTKNAEDTEMEDTEDAEDYPFYIIELDVDDSDIECE